MSPGYGRGECSKEWGHRLRRPCHHSGCGCEDPSASWGLDDDLRFMPVVCLGEIISIRYEWCAMVDDVEHEEKDLELDTLRELRANVGCG